MNIELTCSLCGLEYLWEVNLDGGFDTDKLNSQKRSGVCPSCEITTISDPFELYSPNGSEQYNNGREWLDYCDESFMDFY